MHKTPAYFSTGLPQYQHIPLLQNIIQANHIIYANISINREHSKNIHSPIWRYKKRHEICEKPAQYKFICHRNGFTQMQRKRRASEPCHKAESGTQSTHNKRVAKISATTPMVQIPGGSGMPRNANVPWRCFWQGYPPNTLQNSTCI